MNKLRHGLLQENTEALLWSRSGFFRRFPPLWSQSYFPFLNLFLYRMSSYQYTTSLYYSFRPLIDQRLTKKGHMVLTWLTIGHNFLNLVGTFPFTFQNAPNLGPCEEQETHLPQTYYYNNNNKSTCFDSHKWINFFISKCT